MDIHDLEIYRLSREISRDIWEIYNRLDWKDRKVIGDQWMESTDSIGANIAEGFGRFHYSDKNKFNYNARGSLIEAVHWSELLHERAKMSTEEFDRLHNKFAKLLHQLNSYIQSTYQRAHPGTDRKIPLR